MKFRAHALAGALLAVALTGAFLAEGLPMRAMDTTQAAVRDVAEPASVHDHGGHDHDGMRVVAAPPPLRAMVPAGPGEYAAAPALAFRCPAVASDPLSAIGAASGDRTDVTGCPFRVYDDTFSFGNVALAVNPVDSTQAIFTALHSSPDEGGPTPRSRSPGGTHTAFTSYTQGIQWADQPIDGSPGAATFGESSAVAMDPRGNTYIAYLWSSAGQNESYGSTIGLYKAGPTRDFGAVSQSYQAPETIEGRTPTNSIPRIHLLHVAPAVPAPDLNATGNLTAGPATEAEIGNAAVGDVNATDERMVAVWLERSVAAPYGPNGYAGWIDAVVSDTGSLNTWSRLPDAALIGPCLDASNAVAWDGKVYVACVADKGYDHRSRARIGDIDIWSLDPLTGKTELVGATNLVGGHPVLAVTSDGYFAMATTRLVDEHGATVRIATGWFGTTWTERGDVGPILHAMAGAKPVYDAAVTAISLSERYKIFALVYMEWQKPSDPTTVPQVPAPDPANPAGSRPRLVDYRKFIAVGKECDEFPLAAAEMQLGTGIDATNIAAYQQRPSVFDDFQDGLVNYREANGEDLWYFAVNDYGAVQYGAVVTAAVGSTCPIPVAPLAPPPVPVPQALSIASPANLIVGSTAGVAALAMVAYLLTVKRKAAVTAAAEDK